MPFIVKLLLFMDMLIWSVAVFGGFSARRRRKMAAIDTVILCVFTAVLLMHAGVFLWLVFA